MSKDLFYKFLRSLDSYETITQGLSHKISGNRDLHLNCKDLYGKTIPEFNSTTITALLKSLNKADNLYTMDLSMLDKRSRQCMKTFLEKVRIWEIYLFQHNLKPFMKPYDLIKRSITEFSKFADYVKDYQAYSIRSSIGIDYICTEDNQIFQDINQIFPAKHLINFVRPKDISDLTDYAKTDAKISVSFEPLREKVRKNIKKGQTLRSFDLYDHIDNMNERGSFKKGETTFNEKMSYNPQLSIPDHLLFRINSIQKTPCESRTIAIAEPSCKAFLSYTRSIYSPLLNAKYDYYGKDRWSFENKLHERLNTYHFLFDQKKCGWTFPMELIAMFFEELSDLYPNAYFIKLKEIFQLKDVYYLIDGSTYTPKRGYTLGMFDDVCSFIIACMFELLQDSIEQNDFLSDTKVDGLIFGDDCDIICRTDDIDYFKVICNRWLLMLDKHGITVNLKKSFISPSGIFCEVYGRNNTVQMFKHITYLLNGYDILHAYNTAHAKTLMNSYYRSFTTYLSFIRKDEKEMLYPLFKYIVDTIISNFPYEFSRDEYLLPYEVGGWVQHLEEGENLVLIKCLEGYIHKSFQNVSKVRLPDLSKIAKKTEKEFFYNNMDVYWTTISSALKYDNNNTDVLKDKYFLSLKRTSITEKQWWKYQELRIKAFNSNQSGIIPYSQIPFTMCWFKMKLTPDLFEERDDFLKNVCVRKPKSFIYKEHTYVAPKRALDIIKDKDLKKGPYFGCSFPSGIGMKDLYTCLDKDLAKCQYFIPTDWWLLSKEWDMPIERLYSYMVEKGYDPFLFKPKNYRPSKEVYDLPIFKVFDLKKPIICWCDVICQYITLDAEDMVNISPDVSQWCLEGLLSRFTESQSHEDYLNYIQNLEYRTVYFEEEDDEYYSPVPEGTEGVLPDGAHINIGLYGQYSSVVLQEKTGDTITEVKTYEYVASNVQLIADYDPTLDEDLEDEEEEPFDDEGGGWDDVNVGHDNVLDYSAQYLRNAGLLDDDEEDEEFEPP
jgi:hypothetical protein